MFNGLKVMINPKPQTTNPKQQTFLFSNTRKPRNKAGLLLSKQSIKTKEVDC